MGQGFEREYRPDPERAAVYDKLYAKYIKLGGLIEKELT
jgi:L-ribulokinase